MGLRNFFLFLFNSN